jgi:hypothetical protein
MPKGCVYILRSKHTPHVYVGSTKKSEVRRLQNHLNDYTRFTEGRTKFKTPFHVVRYDDVHATVLEQCEFAERRELLQRERYYLNMYAASAVNVRIPGRTMKEWREENGDKLRANNRRHYYRHQSDILAKKREAYTPKARTTPLKTDLSDHPAYKHYREHKADVLKASALKRVRALGRRPTDLTVKKHGITEDEITAALNHFVNTRDGGSGISM